MLAGTYPVHVEPPAGRENHTAEGPGASDLSPRPKSSPCSNDAHSEYPAPTWQGESVGHYEGDTLVIDTIGQKVGPLSMVDMYGTPFSAALHDIERYRLIDGATARDLQLTHESAYFGAGTLNPTVSEYGIKIDPDSTKPGLQV